MLNILKLQGFLSLRVDCGLLHWISVWFLTLLCGRRSFVWWLWKPTWWRAWLTWLQGWWTGQASLTAPWRLPWSRWALQGKEGLCAQAQGLHWTGRGALQPGEMMAAALPVSHKLILNKTCREHTGNVPAQEHRDTQLHSSCQPGQAAAVAAFPGNWWQSKPCGISRLWLPGCPSWCGHCRELVLWAPAKQLQLLCPCGAAPFPAMCPFGECLVHCEGTVWVWPNPLSHRDAVPGEFTGLV